MKRTKFVPPTDIKQWWRSGCCGPPTSDPSELCGFCGEPVLECARKHSDYIRDHPDYNHDGSIIGDGFDDPSPMTCGGSGFWCSGCGRFWAQNSCGGNFNDGMQAADGAKMELILGKVYCVCGKHLTTPRPVEPAHDPD